MRRDYFTIEVRNVEGPAADRGDVPTIHVRFEGPDDQLLERLTAEGDEMLEASDVDIAYRLQAAIDPDSQRDPSPATVEETDLSGVVAFANRITGEFILEVNADIENVLSFVRAARAYGAESGNSARYRVELTIDGEHVISYDKYTFLVYDEEGGLLREHSLIPNNVEL